MKNLRERALAAAIAITALFMTGHSSADPVSTGDPADLSSSAASGIFAEGGRSSAAPDPVSGILRYSYAFELPAARGGPQPQLALAYSSSSSDGEAGYGWSLNVPMIERRPMSGNPRFEVSTGTRPTSDERFFFAGQPLVRVCSSVASGDCPGEPHPDWATTGGWRYYRLQVEGLFARFYLSPDRRQWRVQLKGGQRMDFGSVDGSSDAIEFIGDEARVVRWRLARHLDALHVTSDGAPLNYVHYRWRKLGKRGLSYLTDIFDTPRAGAHASDLDFAHHTQLSWEEPDYDQTAYADPLHARPDLRLRSVGVSSKTWSGSGPREVTRTYRLRYMDTRAPLVPYDPATMAPLWHHSFLRTIELTGKCNVSELASGQISDNERCPYALPATTFHYEPGSLGVAEGITTVARVQGGPQDLVTNRRVLFDEKSANIVDFNRDGLPDVVQSWPSGPRCAGHEPAFTYIHDPLNAFIPSTPTGQGDIGCVEVHPGPNHTSQLTQHGVVGSSRLMIGYVNQGTDDAVFRQYKFAHQCMDGGSDIGAHPGFRGISPADLNRGYSAAFLTPQGGATIAGAWSTGVVTWAPNVIPNFAPRAFFAEPINGGFGGSGCDPENFDPVNFQPRWRWQAVDPMDWAKEGEAGPVNTSSNWFTDVDGDGLVDQIFEGGQPASGKFKDGVVRFTRRFAANEPQHGAALPNYPTPVQRPFVEIPAVGGSLVPASGKTQNKYFYVDVDGDGLVDVVVWDPSSLKTPPRVRLGDGRGAFGCESGKQPWQCLPAGADLTPGYDIELIGPPPSIFPSEFQFHDVTGDGLADLVQYQYSSMSGGAQGLLSLWINVDGRRFACADPNTNCTLGRVVDDVHSTFDIGSHRMTFADMNADGVADIVFLSKVGVLVASALQHSSVYGQEAPRPGLLTRIDNGVGATTQISYKTIQQLDVEARSTSNRWAHHSRAVEAVVTQIKTRDTLGLNGATVSDPFRFSRTVNYNYKDPAYDRWTRTFSGFRKVAVRIGDERAITETTNWFSGCQNDQFYNVPEDRTDNSYHRCDATSDDEPDKGRTGRPIRVDRYVPFMGERSPERWLWSRTYHWHSARDVTPTEERSVQFAYVSEIETTFYDDALPVQTGTLTAGTGGSDPVEAAPTQAAAKHSLQRFQYDRHGTLVWSEDVGAGVDDTATIQALSNSLLGFEPPLGVPTLACSAHWVCNPTHITLYGRAAGSKVYHRERQLKLFYELPDNSGAVAEKQAFLDTAPPLVRPASAPYPPGSSGVGWRVLESAVHDSWGNVTKVVTGPSSAAPSCDEFVYDTPYQHLLAMFRQNTDGCDSSSSGETALIFDRGFNRVVTTLQPSMAMTTLDLDPYGRVESIHRPLRDGSPSFTRLESRFTYHDDAPMPYVDVDVYPTPSNPISSVLVFNGLGENVLRFDHTGDGHVPWILQPFTIRDGSGQPIIIYHSSEFTGSPAAVAWNQAPLPKQSKYVSHSFDEFGRRYLTTEFPSGLQHERRVYRPLAIETRDAEQSETTGQHPFAFTRVELDGHGRVRKSVQRAGGQDIVTAVTFLPTGEPALVTRSAGADSYARHFVYDSLGRLRANIEPNTGEWRYAWDDAGRLVGTSDARGCGKNIHYDGLGRVVGEDYVPCLPSHPPYSPPVPATGEGFEVFNRYDIYEPGQMLSEPGFNEYARLTAGKLVSRRDRGSYTRFNYDARGSVRRVSRRAAKPVDKRYADPYVADWLTQRSDFDDLGRPTRRTAGASIGAGGPAEETYAYSTRGLLRSIGSSYGALINALEYDPDGAPTRIVYGDLAATQARFTYGINYGTKRLERYEVTRNPPLDWSLNAPPDYPRPDWSTTQTELALFSYEYDAVGNPTLIHDHVSPNQYSNYSSLLPIRIRGSKYDDLYRLIHIDYLYDTPSGAAAFDDGPYEHELHTGDTRPVPLRIHLPTRVKDQSFAYDFMGNLKASSDDLNAYYDRSIGSATYGDANDGPNQLRTADGITAKHDASGNLTELKVSRLGMCKSGGHNHCAQWFAYDWDEVGQLIRARRWDYDTALPSLAPDDLPPTTPSWTLTYAYSQGVRVLKSDNDGLVERHTVDVFDTLRLVRTPFNEAADDYVQDDAAKEVYLAGGLARVFEDTTRALPRTSTANYRHVFLRIPDHLGSSTVVIDRSSSELVSRSSSQAFGAIESDYRPARWGATRDPYKFTGKEEDIEVGLVYFGARYYHPHLMQWASADPLTIHGLGGDLNPYAYVGGRVLSHVDPFGLDSCGADDAATVRCPDGSTVVRTGDRTYDIIDPPNQPSGSPSVASEVSAERGLNGHPAYWDAPGPPSLLETAWTSIPIVAFSRETLSEVKDTLDPRTNFDKNAYPELTALARARAREKLFLSKLAPTILVLLTMGSSSSAVSAAKGIAATEGGSAGAMSASEQLLNWSPKSTPTWGHSFLRHGQGPSVTRSLVGRAAGTGEAQGQWLSNQAAADFLSAERPYIQGPAAVQIPPGVGAQVILPNGTIVPASHALLIPAPGGGFVTAYPFLP